VLGEHGGADEVRVGIPNRQDRCRAPLEEGPLLPLLRQLRGGSPWRPALLTWSSSLSRMSSRPNCQPWASGRPDAAAVSRAG
jgi:hypothetical protein